MADLAAVRAFPRGPILIATSSAGLLGRAVGVRAVGVGRCSRRAWPGVSSGDAALLLLTGGTTVGVALNALELLLNLLLLEIVEFGVAGWFVFEETVEQSQ